MISDELKPEQVAERRQMARAMRQFAAGRMTVDEFECLAREADDYGCFVTADFAWYFYDDFQTDRLVGKWRLTPENRRVWARCVLYLLTSQTEFSDRYQDLCKERSRWKFSQVIRLKWPAPTPYDKEVEEMRSCWPFESREEFEQAKAIRNPFAHQIPMVG